MSIRSVLLASAVMTLFSVPAWAGEQPASHYAVTHFVANKEKYTPNVTVEPEMINAWGIAIRPKGAGGHFWVTAKDTSYQYIGDVSRSPDEALRKLDAKDIKYVKLPVGGDDKFATSAVFSGSEDNFVITQEVKGVKPVTAPAKFLFSSDGGVISAWTERKKADGTFDRSSNAVTVIDESKEGAQFFGLAVNAGYNRIYAANFGKQSGVEVFGSDFKRLPVKFDMPFDENKNHKVDPGEYAPFNIQAMGKHLFVAYAKTQACTEEGIKNQDCKKGELYAGEEDTSKPGYGRLAEFTEDGKLVAVWNDGGKLSAPWGLAYAPENFGTLSGKLLVANFGSGTIAAFDPKTRNFVGEMRDTKGKSLKIDKIWGILFGNGESLGDNNTLYFTAGPDDEKDGVFGSLRLAAAQPSI